MKKNINSENLSNKISIALVIVSILINLVAYRYLPEKISIHTNGNGVPDNYVPKMFFVALTPAILFIINIVSIKLRKNELLKYFALTIILFFVNILIIFSNMKL